jgi:sugar lactone lactonase YvrE
MRNSCRTILAMIFAFACLVATPLSPAIARVATTAQTMTLSSAVLDRGQPAPAGIETNLRPVPGQSANTPDGTLTFLGRNLLRVPDGLALDPQDNLYVSNFANGPIARITQSNQVTEYTHIPANGQSGPAGLTFDQAGNLYIAEYAPAPNGAIYKVPPGGGKVTVFVSGLYNPALMATDSQDHIWVANYGPTSGKSAQVLEYSTGGQLLLDLPLPGADAIAFGSNGDAYIAAYQSGTIYQYDPSTQQLSVFVQSSQLVTCDALAFDPSGNLWVTTYGVINQAIGALYEITPQGKISLFAQHLRNPAAIEFDTSGALYLVMTGEHNVWKYVA